MEILQAIAAQNGLMLTPAMLSQFEKYYEMLLEWNERVNLTAITERKEVEIKHFADSILPVELIPQCAALCDVGTGAGFPGVPLKLLRPDLELTLVDSLNKRIVFLEEAVRTLGLSRVRCLHARAEEFGRSAERECFDIVTSRAVARLNTLCEYALPLVKIGGCFLAYKANCAEETAEARKAVTVLGGKVEAQLEYELCGLHRTVVVIRKLSPTPKKYPRGRGKEKNDPIL